METPQEIEVWYVIPAIRREFAKAYKEQGLSQSDIARRMGITPAAVSQYINKKRGKDIHLPDDVLREVRKSVRRTYTARTAIKTMEEIQRICRIMRRKGLLCRVHRKHSKQSLRNCNICLRKKG